QRKHRIARTAKFEAASRLVMLELQTNRPAAALAERRREDERCAKHAAGNAPGGSLDFLDAHGKSGTHLQAPASGKVISRPRRGRASSSPHRRRHAQAVA